MNGSTQFFTQGCQLEVPDSVYQYTGPFLQRTLSELT